MPAFLTAEFWNLSNPELWVGVGLLLFLAIVIFGAKVHLTIGQALDDKACAIKAELDEAARIRAEAQALLAQLQAERAEAEAHAAAMLENAQAEATRLAAEAEAKLAETLARRQALAERRIALAETQALAEVKSAAADMAAQAAETLLAGRLTGKKSDPMVDAAIGRLGTSLG